jgi:hypothetical protein
MSPAKKFSPASCTPASRIAVTKASTARSAGTASANGHQNSTAVKPASAAACGRASSGSSVKSIDRFTSYRGAATDDMSGVALPLGGAGSVVPRRQFPLYRISLLHNEI